MSLSSVALTLKNLLQLRCIAIAYPLAPVQSFGDEFRRHRMKKATAPPKPRVETRAVQPFVLSRKVMVLANLLKRGAGSRYRRLLGLPQGEWGVIAQLGDRAPRTLGDLAAGMGLDITQISRSVSNLVAQGFVTRAPNPFNNREVLIALSKKGNKADAVIREAGALANKVLLDGFTENERTILAHQLERLTILADQLLVEEQALNPETSEMNRARSPQGRTRDKASRDRKAR